MEERKKTETEQEWELADQYASEYKDHTEDELAKYAFSTLLEPATVRMEKLGRVVVYPKPNEIQLDIDTEEAFDRFLKTYKIAKRLLVFTKDPEIKSSASGKEGHRHVTLFMEEEVGDLERIALQAILGSDGNRELFNFFRLSELGISDSCFFEKREEELGFPDFPSTSII